MPFKFHFYVDVNALFSVTPLLHQLISIRVCFKFKIIRNQSGLERLQLWQMTYDNKTVEIGLCYVSAMKIHGVKFMTIANFYCTEEEWRRNPRKVHGSSLSMTPFWQAIVLTYRTTRGQLPSQNATTFFCFFNSPALKFHYYCNRHRHVLLGHENIYNEDLRKVVILNRPKQI